METGRIAGAGYVRFVIARKKPKRDESTPVRNHCRLRLNRRKSPKNLSHTRPITPRSQILVDTSALISVVLNEGTKKAIVAATVDATLVAPASIHWEFGNALSALLKRKRISKQEAWDCLEEYGKIPVQFVDVDMIEAISIAEKHHIYAYDAYMVAAAKQYRIPLLSLDSGLREIAKKEKVRLLEA